MARPLRKMLVTSDTLAAFTKLKLSYPTYTCVPCDLAVKDTCILVQRVGTRAGVAGVLTIFRTSFLSFG